jgi:hypothetical protein
MLQLTIADCRLPMEKGYRSYTILPPTNVRMLRGRKCRRGYRENILGEDREVSQHPDGESPLSCSACSA